MKHAAGILVGAAAGVSACSTIFGDFVVAADTAGTGGTTATSTSTASTSSTSTGCSNGKCGTGMSCLTGADCQSLVCTNGTCQAPTCSDGVKNGDETDIDCGDTTCAPCPFGEGCLVNSDCTTGFCNGKTCDAKTIVGGLTNPNSLAVDYWGVYWADGDDGTVMQADFATVTQTALATGRIGPQALTIYSPGANLRSGLMWVEPSTGNVMTTTTQFSSGGIPWAQMQTSPSAVVALPNPTPPYEAAPAWTAAGSVWMYSMTPQQVGTFTGSGGKIVVVPGSTQSCVTLLYSSSDVGGTLWTVQRNSLQPQSSCNGGNGMATKLVPGTPIVAIAADTAFGYWTDGAMPGTVWRVAFVGGASKMALRHV